MFANLPERVTVALDAAEVPLNHSGPSGIACRRCGEPLDLSQPDPQDPDRWLGTCAGCGGWHLVELIDEERMALVVLLPVVEIVRAALRTAGARPA